MCSRHHPEGRDAETLSFEELAAAGLQSESDSRIQISDTLSLDCSPKSKVV